MALAPIPNGCNRTAASSASGMSTRMEQIGTACKFQSAMLGAPLGFRNVQ
jgi:hypothetical protein